MLYFSMNRSDFLRTLAIVPFAANLKSEEWELIGSRVTVSHHRRGRVIDEVPGRIVCNGHEHVVTLDRDFAHPFEDWDTHMFIWPEGDATHLGHPARFVTR